MSDELEQGIASFEQRAWGAAYRCLSIADREQTLTAEQLELLALSAYFVGEVDEYLSTLERAHTSYLEQGDEARAVRCAFWIGLQLAFRKELGRAGGWLARAERILRREERERVEHGYLLLPSVMKLVGEGDHDEAFATASRAVAIGEHFDDPELVAMARHQQGRVRLEQQRVAEGLALLDETMVSVTADELPPLSTGLIYCSVIDGCHQVYALDHAKEWTDALTRWLADQPEMVAFSTTCLTDRAKILQIQGAWPDAMREAQRARERCSDGRVARSSAASAIYQQAEIHRLRGEHGAAEQAYSAAGREGFEVQPGLALLRLAQGRPDEASAGIRRAVSAGVGRLHRPALLFAQVEIALATDQLDEARTACDELDEIAASLDTVVLHGLAAQARGAVQLAEGHAEAALRSLRRGLEQWRRVDAPYYAARVRELVGLACRALGDTDGSRLELLAAKSVFEQLGAKDDAARLDSLCQPASAGRTKLSPRELQVLRLVAAGKTNRSIAGELGLSVKTVDRHVSNIFCKLDVTSRAAATAYAYEHDLI